jgi:hypothetical protein
MAEKKKKTKKDVKVRHRDMKPRKDAKGGGGPRPSKTLSPQGPWPERK